MPPPEISRRFSFLGLGDWGSKVEPRSSIDGAKKVGELAPILKLQTDKTVYRPGDEVIVTIEVQIPRDPASSNEISTHSEVSLLLERLSFELKGVEKLDTQWFSTQKPLPGSKQRRGEHVFLDSSTTSLVSNQIISHGTTKKYLVRTVLPNIMPPSYRGATIRYLYYVRSVLSGQWLIMENGHSDGDLRQNVSELETRVPFQVWVTQKASGLPIDESQTNGIVPILTVQTDIYWKEMDGDSDWARANEIYAVLEEDYDSSRDEISSVSSYIPSRESIHKAFGSSSSLQGSAARSFREPLHAEADEVLQNSNGDMVLSNTPAEAISPSQQRRYLKSFPEDDDGKGVSSSVGPVESVASEGYLRGKSYNIKLDDLILLKFSPKKSDSNYYFSDAIGGTLSFIHEGARRCLEVSITLEISETINRHFVHPSRRNSSMITKVHSDHHEVVADIVQTSFLFSVPTDGPMSFSTPHVSVQWALRFEFFTTPRNVDWRRFDHPLLVEGRDKCEWSLPIIVHAPQPGAAAGHTRGRKSLSFEPLWIRD